MFIKVSSVGLSSAQGRTRSALSLSTLDTSHPVSVFPLCCSGLSTINHQLPTFRLAAAAGNAPALPVSETGVQTSTLSGKMVAREGAAPPISGCRPDVILFHHRAEIGCLAWIRTKTIGVKARHAAITPQGKELVEPEVV